MSENSTLAEQHHHSVSLAGWMRIVLRILFAAIGFIPALVLHYVWFIASRSSPLPMLYLRYLGWAFGVRVERRGKPVRRDVLCAANHTSWLDILILAGQTGTAFIAKGELKKNPVMRWLCGLNHTIFVDRTRRGDVESQLAQIREAMRDNWSITVFPEGTTTDNQHLLPFKSSLLQAVFPPPPGARIQPIFLDYGPVGSELGWVGDETALTNILRVLSRPGSFTVQVHYLADFSPNACTDRKALGKRLQGDIQQAMEDARGA